MERWSLARFMCDWSVHVQQSPVESGHGAPGEVVSDEEEMEEGWREEGGGEEGGGEEGGEDTQEEEVLTNKTPATDGETAVKTKTKSRTKSTSLSNPKQAGIEKCSSLLIARQFREDATIALLLSTWCCPYRPPHLPVSRPV